jgi:anti-sigma B factor antagonist
MSYITPFSCRSSDSGVGAAWVHVAGELDLATSPQLAAALREAQFGASTVVLDLRALSFIDSAGARVIAAAAARARPDGRRLMVVRGPPEVERLLTLTGTAGELETFDLPPATGSATYARETVWAEA